MDDTTMENTFIPAETAQVIVVMRDRMILIGKEDYELAVMRRDSTLAVVNLTTGAIPYVYVEMDAKSAKARFAKLVNKMIAADINSKYYANTRWSETCRNGRPGGHSPMAWATFAYHELSGYTYLSAAMENAFVITENLDKIGPYIARIRCDLIGRIPEFKPEPKELEGEPEVEAAEPVSEAVEKTYTIDDLLAELERLWAMPKEELYESEGIVYLNVGGNDEQYEKLQQISAKALDMCDALLITKGYPNADNIKRLEACGYHVYPTEKDSYGWLSAAINKNGRIMFFG